MSSASSFSALTEVLPRLTHPDGSPSRLLVVGTVDVGSRPGRTRFTVRLPLLRSV